jgi:protoheme IX farnesyltransferase
MSVIATPDSAAEATTPAHGRTRAQRRDSFRSTAALTALIGVLTLLNVLWWALSAAHSFAPVLGSWLLLTMAMGLLSVAGSARGGHRTIQWLTWALQPLAVALVALVNTTYSPAVGAWTLAVGAASAAVSLALVGLAYRSQPSAPVEKPATRLSDFRMLMKFRIISLLLLTTLVPMYLANGGEWPRFWVVALTLLGGTLAAGGANAINMYIDRDIDSVMSRTKRRPLPGNRLSGREVLGFGLLLSVLAFAVLLPVNLLTASLAIGGIFYYVVIYTLWLKRSTVQNIVIGGAAGAIPPLVGWAAGANLNLLTASPIEWLPAVFLFAIVFYWTPPHFWALAIVRREDYARAGVPMLPVVRGEAETRRQIILYTFIMLSISLMLCALQVVGLLYLASATVLGAIFLYYAVKMYHDHSHAAAWRLYKYSLLYLALLFVAMGIDRALLS